MAIIRRRHEPPRLIRGVVDDPSSMAAGVECAALDARTAAGSTGHAGSNPDDAEDGIAPDATSGVVTERRMASIDDTKMPTAISNAGFAPAPPNLARLYPHGTTRRRRPLDEYGLDHGDGEADYLGSNVAPASASIPTSRDTAR